MRCGLRPKSLQILPIVDFRQAGPLGHLGPGPMRGVLRCRLQGCDHHVLDLVDADRGRAAGARLVAEPVEAIRNEPATPLAHRRRGTAELASDRLVVGALRAPQHDARAQRQRLRRLRLTCPSGQLVTLFGGQGQLGFRASSSRHTPVYDLPSGFRAHDTRGGGHCRPGSTQVKASHGRPAPCRM